VTGTPVAWRDAGAIEPPTGEDVLEALWDEDGAICLERRGWSAATDVEAKCQIPRATTTSRSATERCGGRCCPLLTAEEDVNHRRVAEQTAISSDRRGCRAR
jgi:hypothetical protein